MTSRFEFGYRKPGQASARIYRALEAAGAAGLSRREIQSVFSRNAPVPIIAAALEELYDSGKATVSSQATRGRPRQVWRIKR